MKRSLSFVAVAFATLVCSGSAVAQDANYPSRPIKIVVPFSAGGVVDSVARIVGERLAVRLKQPVVIDNRPGAGGSIGAAAVAKSDPDGYTLLAVSTYFAVVPGMMKSPAWQPTTDFKAIAGIGMIPNILVVNPENSAKSFQDLLNAAKSKSAPLTYASPGVGTSNHLTGELLSQMTGTKMVHVPYKGQTDALSDLVAGRVDMMALTSALAGEYVRAGKLKPLVVTTSVRSSALPEVPTVEEASALRPFDVRSWFGFVAPAKTSNAVVSKVSEEIRSIMDEKDVVEKLVKLGLERNFQGPTPFQTYIGAEQIRWKAVVEKAGIVTQ